MNHTRITERDVIVAAALLREAVEAKLSANERVLGGGQAFSAEVIPTIVNQILVPALVAVGAEASKDALKGLYQSLKDVTARFVGEHWGPRGPESREGVTELNAQLGPLGFTDSDVDRLCTDLKRRLEK